MALFRLITVFVNKLEAVQEPAKTVHVTLGVNSTQLNCKSVRESAFDRSALA